MYCGLHRSIGVQVTQVNWYTSYTGKLVYCGLHRSIGVQATQVYWCISYTGQLVYSLHKSIGVQVDHLQEVLMQHPKYVFLY